MSSKKQRKRKKIIHNLLIPLTAIAAFVVIYAFLLFSDIKILIGGVVVFAIVSLIFLAIKEQ